MYCVSTIKQLSCIFVSYMCINTVFSILKLISSLTNWASTLPDLEGQLKVLSPPNQEAWQLIVQLFSVLFRDKIVHQDRKHQASRSNPYWWQKGLRHGWGWGRVRFHAHVLTPPSQEVPFPEKDIMQGGGPHWGCADFMRQHSGVSGTWNWKVVTGVLIRSLPDMQLNLTL